MDMNLSDLVLQHVSESSWMSVLPALLEEAPMEGLYAEFLHRGIKVKIKATGYLSTKQQLKTLQLDIGFNNVCAQFNPKYDSFSLVLEIVQGTFAAMIIVGSPTLGFNLNFENTRILLRDYDGSRTTLPLKNNLFISLCVCVCVCVSQMHPKIRRRSRAFTARSCWKRLRRPCRHASSTGNQTDLCQLSESTPLPSTSGRVW